MLFAPDDMRDTHKCIIDNHHKIIHRKSARSYDNKIIKLIYSKRDFSFDEIIKKNLCAILGQLKTNNMLLDKIFTEYAAISAIAIVHNKCITSRCFAIPRNNFFRRTKTTICFAILNQLLGNFLMRTNS